MIVKSYPHAHHLIELTKDNYTDPNISLNIKIIVTLCKKCHDKVHARFQKQESIVNNLFEIDYSQRMNQLNKTNDELKFEINELEKENEKIIQELMFSEENNKTLIKKVLENSIKINKNKNKLKQ